MEKTGDAKAMPWTDGNYRVKDMSNMVFVVKGETVSMLMLNDTASAEETDDFKKYIPTDAVEPSLAVSKQKPLKGCSKERIKAAENGMPSMMKMMARKEYDMEPILVFYSNMCQDILNERKRLGGDFAITQAVATKEMRDHIRAVLGPELVFVILNLSKEEQEDRAKGRHSQQAEFAEFLSDAHEFFEPAAKDEPNTIEVEITRDLTREDVCKLILDKVDSLNDNNNN